MNVGKYFIGKKHLLSLIKAPKEQLLRESQLGALYAIASHFTVRDDEAIVAMPTGTGKTAVMMMAPYLLEAKRVLLISSSRLVRSQIAEDFTELRTLKELAVLPADLPPPIVYEIEERVKTKDSWALLKEHDVLVAIPTSVSPAIKEVAKHPKNFFDLILIDEAHHSPASTWEAILQRNPKAKKILFTATPFRNDLKELPGRLIYVYPVKRSYDEGVLTQIRFEPVDANGGDIDVEIARMAESVLKRDRKNGLNHLLMVRTDGQKRSEELLELYRTNTSLKLELIHSGKSYNVVKETVQKLRERKLDGIVCVDMLGEGFDLPYLKIAAIHSPHKSLAITLQFIGRCARSNARDIGNATFIACPAEIQIEGEKLYEEGKVWQEIIPNLADLTIEQEAFNKETFEEFAPLSGRAGELDSSALRRVSPYCHVKVYQTTVSPNLRTPLKFGKRSRVVLRELNQHSKTLVVIVEREHYPRWSWSKDFATSVFELYVVYFDKDAGLLFVHTSSKSETTYANLVEALCKGEAKQLPEQEIDKVLADMEDYEFFNVGLRSRIRSTKSETYRIIAGPDLQDTITPTDGMNFVRGHVFAKAKDKNETISVGFSSGGKVWRNTHLRIPQFIKWCQAVAQRLTGSKNLLTHTAMDQLAGGESFAQVPDDVLTGVWSFETYQKPPRISVRTSAGNVFERELLDCEIKIDRNNSTAEKIAFSVEDHDESFQFIFEPNGSNMYQSTFGAETDILVKRGFADAIPLSDYLNAHPLMFYLPDCSTIVGNTLFKFPTHVRPNLMDSQIEVIDWNAANVDIRAEVQDAKAGLITIHAHLSTLLQNTSDIVYWDDGPREAADFITFKINGNDVEVKLYHCKYSSEDFAGDRKLDCYEVCGQAIKCSWWLMRVKHLLEHIQRRFKGNKGKAKFLKGGLKDIQALLAKRGQLNFKFSVVLVQPGISAGARVNVAEVLAGTNDYVMKHGGALSLMCSA